MAEHGLPDPVFARIEIEDLGGQARMTLTDGPYPEPGASGVSAGWEASFDKLETVLAPSR
jgi:hypothetical protein